MKYVVIALGLCAPLCSAMDHKQALYHSMSQEFKEGRERRQYMEGYEVSCRTKCAIASPFIFIALVLAYFFFQKAAAAEEALIMVA